jgi:predicted  nucleic acid-binding Zn-ribbon protein
MILMARAPRQRLIGFRYPAMSNLKMFILGVSVFIVAHIGSVMVEMRRRCPDCGRRGFRRLASHHGDDDDTPAYVIRECKSCGMLQVECDRGVERLPRAAKEYARNAPRGFEVITKDAAVPSEDKGE